VFQKRSNQAAPVSKAEGGISQRFLMLDASSASGALPRKSIFVPRRSPGSSVGNIRADHCQLDALI